MYASSNLGVALDAFAITPSNTVNLGTRARSIYVGGSGNITILTPKGTTILFANVPEGTILPVEALRVNATGTTATSLVGLS